MGRNRIAFACLCLSLSTITIIAPITNQSQVFSEAQVDFFQQEGYIKVSGLLGSDLVSDLAQAAEVTIENSPRFPFFYSVSQTGLLFGSSLPADSQPEATIRSSVTNTFRETALFSKLPQAVAELMKLDPEKHNLRVLRDVFLAKSVEDEECCDWHVDDLGFWPESFLNEMGMDGINVWIALDDMPAAYQGSMAIAPRSHTAEWRDRAYQALGQNRSLDGGKTKEEVIRKRQLQQEHQEQAKEDEADPKPKSKYPTCDMRLADPEIRETVDSHKQVLDYKRGDVIFATRLLFHRTMPVTDAGLEYYKEQGIEHLSRYSIRYVPGTARLPKGWSVEWSIVDDNDNAGQSLDRVTDESEKLFYPQVWPKYESHLPTKLQEMERALPSLAQRAQAEFMATIFGK